MYIVLLFLLVSNFFTSLLAMDYTGSESFTFHGLVHEVATGRDLESAKKELKKLFRQGKDPNVLSDKKL